MADFRDIANGTFCSFVKQAEEAGFTSKSPERTEPVRLDSEKRKAEMINGYLLVPSGSRIGHVGCGSGALTYALALTNPRMEYVGIHSDPDLVRQAEETYSLPNLSYKCVDVFEAGPDLSDLDAIVLADILHKAYAHDGFRTSAILALLEACFARLKTGGQILIKDYILRNPDKRVCLELPYYETKTEEVEKFLWFCEHVEAAEKDFEFEELESDSTHTRIFMLPYKWAYEYVIGKDRSGEWEQAPPRELTSFTTSEYRTAIENMGGRVLYMTPYEDTPYVRQYFHERFRFFDKNGNRLPFPPTTYFIVAQKTEMSDSLFIFETGAKQGEAKTLTTSAVRDEKTGHLLELVHRADLFSDLIPYRFAKNGRLNVFLTENVPQCIANTIASKSQNLDERQWSGHLTEAIALPAEEIQRNRHVEERDLRAFIEAQTGLIAANGVVLEEGPSMYPAPDYIDELRDCYYLRVADEAVIPDISKSLKNLKRRFETRPVLKELDVQDVLDAIRVGLVPSALLETQILALMEKLGVDATRIEDTDVVIDTAEPANRLNRRQLLSFLSSNVRKYKDVREKPGHLRTVRSSFINEGKVDRVISPIATQEEDFVVFDKQTINTALVIPLTKDLSGEVLVGFEARFLPVPERLSGNSAVITAPSFPLPKEIVNGEMAREYVAKQFNVKPERVGKLGESYFCNIDITPHRIYPFVVASPAFDKKGWKDDGFTAYAPMKDIWKIIYHDKTKSPMMIAARLFTRFAQNSEHSMNHQFSKSFLPDKNYNPGSYANIHMSKSAPPGPAAAAIRERKEASAGIKEKSISSIEKEAPPKAPSAPVTPQTPINKTQSPV